MSRRTIILILIALFVVTPSFLVISGVISKKQIVPAAVALTWWTIDDSPESLADILQAYQQLHPYITVTVVQKPADTYEAELKDAWAKDQGPDIFSLPNTAVASFKDFVQPLPKQTRTAFFKTRNLLVREEQEITYQVESSITPNQVRQEYIDTVAKDVVLRDAPGAEQVYGLPLAVDTLMLFYNRDLLSSAGIIDPPATWEDFVAAIPRLTLQDSDGNVVRPGVGLGLAKNVPYAFDVLSLLMLQNGARMVDPSGRQTLFHRPNEAGETPGLGALKFYTDFAQTNPPKEVLTWAATFPTALNLFAQGKLAMAFGYQRDRKWISAQSANLNYDVAPIPHIHENELDNDATAPAGDQLRKITYGRYAVQAVALKARQKTNEAWNLVQFASRSGVVRNYLGRTGQVSALRKVLREQQANPALAVAALQTPAIRSWYHGQNFTATEQYFTALIEAVALKGNDAASALDLAADQINLTLPKPQ